MVGGPNVGRESAALHAAARPEASNVSEASRASEIENKAQREVSSIWVKRWRGSIRRHRGKGRLPGLEDGAVV